jgi:alkylhydroperoxidase family enzyme
MLKMVGFDDPLIEALERDIQLADLAEPDRLALDFARKVSKSNPRPRPEDRERLRRAGYSDAAVAEIAYAAAVCVVSNRMATLLALPAERMVLWADHPMARLLRPITARILRVRPAKAEPLPQPNDGPCAEVVAALAGAPAARELREVIDEALASPVLPRRTKLLMMGVIGRALGCAHAEEEVRAGLLAEGFDAAELADVLANLASPRLDEREALLVPYARETVRYRNVDVQERTRVLAERLSRAEVLEAVGIASLANGVCRLSVLLDAC